MSFQPTSSVNRPAGARRTVLIAVDGSDHSKYAFRWSLNNIIKDDDWVVLASTMKADITKAETVKGSKWVEVPVDATGDETENHERSRLQNMFGTYQSELHSKSIPAKLVYLKGDAREALVGKASELSADIMIMGSRGMTGLKKAIMGSVSDYCVHNAGCPVLIVRKPNQQ